MLKRAMTIIAAAAIAITANVMVASPASAAYGCTGSLVGSWALPLKDRLDGKTYYRSDVKLYYDAGTGWNCAALVKRPGLPRYGDNTPLFIEMYNERWAEDNYKNNYDQDQGNFKYYAGPIKVYGKNMCVSIHASHADHEADGGPADYNGRLSLTGVACG
jgi:hypothetical protein